MKRKLGIIVLAITLCFSLTGCDDEFWEDEYDSSYEEDYDNSHEGNNEDIFEITGDPNQTWTICWYLCGSDLESEGGAATEDLDELMQVELPDNIQFVIQTGGAGMWQNDLIDPNCIQRYLYSSDGLSLIDEQPQANMGEAETFSDFLYYCDDQFQSDKKVLLFWNHGGGSVSGVAFDENYGYDSLTLDEIQDAFYSIYDLPTEELPFELIGFDTCLMATIDTAYVSSLVSNYMVASEEYEPGCGWLYSEWVHDLAEKPGMNGAQLGKCICDTYIEGCSYYDVADETTLSVVDLTKLEPLLNAYEAMGVEALSYSAEDPSFFCELGREASITENYGGNTRSEGYSNMLDLGHLAENCADILPLQSQAVLRALDNCVTYKVNGPYRENARGLSCYYSYNGDYDDLEGFKVTGYSDAFKYFFDYEIQGCLDAEGLKYIDNYEFEEIEEIDITEELPEIPEAHELQEVPTLSDYSDMEYPLYLDEEGLAVLELDSDTVDMLKGLYFQLAYVDEEEDIMILLGQDNDIVCDWENGIFKDNFRYVWGCIDGYLVYMEVSEETDDYTFYSVPILLNGEEYNLRVIYDYNDEEFHILGARQEMNEGMADKDLVQLEAGDEITTIHYVATASGSDDFEPVEMDTFTVTEDTSFYETDLGDGTFLMMFELMDAKNNYAYSEMLQLTVEGEYVDIEILE